MNIEHLLTEEFLVFSKKIVGIYNRKLEKKQELKIFYEKIQEDLKALDDEARAATEEFENWQVYIQQQVEAGNATEQ